MSTQPPKPQLEPSEPPERGPSAAERAFPVIMRYSGLFIALFEGFVDRPPQYLVIGLATMMMAGAQVLESVVRRRNDK